MSENETTPKEKVTEGEEIKKKPPVKSSKKEETPVNRTKFIGFHRHSSGGPWTLLSVMLASEESIKHKIKLFKGDCEVFVLEVNLPD